MVCCIRALFYLISIVCYFLTFHRACQCTNYPISGRTGDDKRYCSDKIISVYFIYGWKQAGSQCTLYNNIIFFSTSWAPHLLFECRSHEMGVMRSTYGSDEKFEQTVSLKGWHYLKDTDLNGRIILKWSVQNVSLKDWLPLLGRYRLRWENNIKIDIKDGCEGVEWILV